MEQNFSPTPQNLSGQIPQTPQSPQTPPVNLAPPTSPLPIIPTPKPQILTQRNIILGFLILFIVLGVFAVSKYSSLKFKTADTGSSELPLSSPTSTTTPQKALSAYATDTDLDGIPDNVETAIDLDPIISEFTRCQPESCGTVGLSNAENTKNNILIILDSSGSMDLKMLGKSKMDLAKEAIKSFIESSAANVNIGLMVYGHKGSNSTSDKSTSCASAEIIAPIGSVGSTSVDGYLANIKPTGWTNIGLAIRNGKNAFIDKEGQKNQIIVVTDGAETCDTNPTGAASEVKASSYQIRVDVIGFGVSAAEQTSLQSISSNGGGLFSVATNVDQLLGQMKAVHENFEKFQSNAKCVAAASATSTSCLQDAKQKAFSYLGTQIIDKHGAEYQEISNLQLNISSLYFKKISTIQDEASAVIKESLQKIQ